MTYFECPLLGSATVPTHQVLMKETTKCETNAILFAPHKQHIGQCTGVHLWMKLFFLIPVGEFKFYILIYLLKDVGSVNWLKA